MSNETKKQAKTVLDRALAAQMQGKFESAINLYQESIALDPSAEAHTFLGWTYSYQGKLEEAIAECKVAITVDPDFGNPYNDIGSYLMMLGRSDEAIPWLEKAVLATRYECYHYPHLNLGRIFLNKGMLNRAREEFEAVLKFYPESEAAKEILREISLSLN